MGNDVTELLPKTGKSLEFLIPKLKGTKLTDPIWVMDVNRRLYPKYDFISD